MKLTKEQKNTIKELKEYKKQILATRESAKQFLIKVGIIDNNEKLTKEYS